MKILRIVFCMGIAAYLLFSGSVRAQMAGSAPASGNSPSSQGVNSLRPKQVDSEDTAVQGKVVYLNKVTGQIIVMGENNVKRRVRVSPLQMKKMRVGQGVDISLRDGGFSAQSIRIMRKNRDRGRVPRYR